MFGDGKGWNNGMEMLGFIGSLKRWWVVRNEVDDGDGGR